MKSTMHFSGVFLVAARVISGRALVAGLTFGMALGLFTVASAESGSLHEQLPQLSQSKLWSSTQSTNLESQAHAKTTNDLSNNQGASNHSIEDARMMTLNTDLMRNLLQLNDYGINNLEKVAAKQHKSVEEGTQKSSKTYDISLPLPNGSIIDITIVKDSVLPTKLAEKYPDINTYRVLSNDVVFSGKVDISPSGFHAMLQMLDGEIVFVDPVQVDKNQYAVFNKSAQKTESHRKHSCGVDSSLAMNKGVVESLLSTAARDLGASVYASAAARSPESLKSYTIAVATTGEYSAKFGGSVGGTLAAITTTINRVNQVLERDLGIHLNLAEDNDLLINTNAMLDPFDEEKLLDLVYQNQDFIDGTIGSSNYDLGHLFTTSGGGLAAIASACHNSNKAKAASGITSPRGDSFDLDFVAHEIGHQLGATHTFNSSQGACSTETRTARTAFEPGSGSSIMSYAGYCGLDNIQSNTDAMYHIGSIKQIAQYTNTGYGNRCGVVTPSQNTPPQADAGQDYTIPARTPFELTGNAIDGDNDALLYAWEQLDAGDTSTESSDKGNNALFRVHAPRAFKTRSFPPLESILNHTSLKGESLPSYKRNLTMSFVAQDSFNVAQSDEMTINVVRTGSRFALNYPRAHYTRGSTYPIYWNVAKTDKSPVNCSSVNVLLSIDGGQNFDISMGDNIHNSGETLITIPADVPTTSQGRFKIKCSDNIFFAVSHRNFFITVDDNSISLEYPNEDQPETNLRDVDLNSTPAVSGSGIVDNSSNNFSSDSGGGTFGFMIGYLFLAVIFIRRKFKFMFSRDGLYLSH